jgi:hypothetical protein
MHLVRGKLSLKSGLKGVPVNNPLAYEARIKVNEKITSLLGGNFSSYNLAIRDFSIFSLGVEGIGIRVDSNNKVYLIIPVAAVESLEKLLILRSGPSFGPLAHTVRFKLLTI